MKLIFDDPASTGKQVEMAGMALVHGQEIEVPAGLVDACLRSGKFKPALEPAPAAGKGILGRLARRASRTTGEVTHDHGRNSK